MLDWLYEFFGTILAFFYGLVPNLGVAIIMLTVVVMLALFPLTAKQAKAMLNMQRAQPEIKRIQQKYKNDKQKQNEEVMKFYQENKINPLAGCLPLLVQMPIFLALFNLMRNPYKFIPKSSDLYAAFCGGSDVTEKVCSNPPLPHHLTFLGMDLSENALNVPGGFLDALPYFVLVGLVVVTGFLQARQSKRNAPNMNSQMAVITQILPIGFGLFSLQFPAGLVLYYFVSNLWRLGQQELIMRKITRPGMAEINAASGKAIDAKSADKAADDTVSPPTGLRKLFQPAPRADATVAADPASSGTNSGGAATGGTTNGSSAAPVKATAARGAKPSGTPTTPGGQRRKNNKRKKKR
jgi:YidC/Oxa1 family membrane protein insertase